MNIKDNKLYLALKAEKSNVEIHKHSAFQIVITEDNHFHSTLENEKYQNIFGFVIKPQVAHACICDQSNLIILNIEPYSILGKLVSEKLGNSRVVIFRKKKDFFHFFESQTNEFSVQNFIKNFQQNQSITSIDERIHQSIAYINENFNTNNISTPDIAKKVFLSPSRLADLFKKQIGSSISKYLLWTRLRNAIFQILLKKDKSLTTIALECGFYDSSQMNKYMYQMFGISPSKLKQKSDLIQFLEI
jgi:AraC-like DNA-binding protein